jgi:hypothetical protein
MITEGMKALCSGSSLGRTIAFSCLFALKNMQVEDGKVNQIKPHRGTPMGLLERADRSGSNLRSA